jgi:probable phosphoglycerate mutase
MPHTTLWLIRHGETAWNTQRRFQDHTDIPLNATGRQQADRLAHRLAEQHRTQPFAALYSSDLSRAHDTALATGRATGLTVQPDPALRERHYGVLSTLTPEEMAEKHPEHFAQWQARNPDHVLPGGESLLAFSERILARLRAIAARHAGQHVLIVAHGGVLDCAYRAATQMPLSAKRTHALHNASLNRLHYDGTRFSLETWGDVAHLDTEAFDEL